MKTTLLLTAAVLLSSCAALEKRTGMSSADLLAITANVAVKTQALAAQAQKDYADTKAEIEAAKAAQKPITIEVTATK